MADFFPTESIIRQVSAEPALLFGAGRALLLQLAHPNVAQGVADHSDFQHNPFRRLQGTLEAMYAIVFGSEELATGVGRRISWVHEHVVGPSYRANDYDNLLWVHATLMDTALGCYLDLVGPLSASDQETYYEEMTRVASVFGCPREAQPADLAEFGAYFADRVASIEVTDVGRRLAADIVRPKLPGRLDLPLGPALSVHRLVAIGTTPEPLRERLGFHWDAKHERRLRQVRRTVRRAFKVTPRPVRVAPVLANGRLLQRSARRHVAEFDARQQAS